MLISEGIGLAVFRIKILDFEHFSNKFAEKTLNSCKIRKISHNYKIVVSYSKRFWLNVGRQEMAVTRNLRICLLVACSLVLCGCGKAKKADENKPLSEVKAEAEKMNAGQLRETALVYKSAIEAKTADIEKVMVKVKEVPLTDALGEEAKKLKADIDNFTRSLEALKQRFEVYYQKLKEKGGDLSGLEMP
jgi:hypothetical protein